MTDTYWPELAGTLFEEAGDALFLFDPDMEQLREVNPMAQRLSGFTRRELLEMKITYLFRSEAEGGVSRLRHAFRRTGLFHSQEGFWLRHKEGGHWVPVNLTVNRLHVEPKPLGIITARDISERREAFAQLQKVEQELRRVLNSVSDCLWSAQVDANGRFVYSYISSVMQQIAGRPAEYFMAGPQQWLGIVHPEDRGLLRGVLAQISTGSSVQHEYRINFLDGGIRWVRDSIVATPAAAGGFKLDGVLSDITARKEAEEALRAGEARYRSLVENLTQSVFLKDRELRYLAANKPFCRSVGKDTEAEILGQDDFDLYPEHLAEKYRAADRLVLQEGRRLELEEQNLIGGKLRTVQKVKTPVLDAQGQIAGVLGIFWDVTDQRLMEAQLRQAHKMEAVGQLAGGIAHDFNNLLTGILGNLSLALADLPRDHGTHELLASAEVAALRAAELTRQLLGFSRRAPLVSQPLNINSLIDETVRLLRRTLDPRIAIQVRAAADLWSVQGDATQVGQVVLNLCLNARDAMRDGGSLTLETANFRLDAEGAPLPVEGRAGEFVRLRVLDTGAGMAPEVQERIFEPFFTTKEPGKGTGLGLAMVFGIVKQHQGWIECRSEVGRGTTFDIYLPRLATAVPVPASAPAEGGVRGGGETILLADDEEVVGRLGQTILERQGYTVLNALDGVEAVEIYRQQGQSIDLVILDLAMPRLSGPETLHELRRLNPKVSVLISSGYSSDEDLRTVERAGVMGFVAKPYRPADLVRRVRAALDQIRDEAANDASSRRR